MRIARPQKKVISASRIWFNHLTSLNSLLHIADTANDGSGGNKKETRDCTRAPSEGVSRREGGSADEFAIVAEVKVERNEAKGETRSSCRSSFSVLHGYRMKATR